MIVDPYVIVHAIIDLIVKQLTMISMASGNDLWIVQRTIFDAVPGHNRLYVLYTKRHGDMLDRSHIK